MDEMPIGDNARAMLLSIVERIERLDEEKSALSDDIKEIYAEAKSKGFDSAILRKVIRLRAMDPDKRAEQEALIDTYMVALDRSGE